MVTFIIPFLTLSHHPNWEGQGCLLLLGGEEVLGFQQTFFDNTPRWEEQNTLLQLGKAGSLGFPLNFCRMEEGWKPLFFPWCFHGIEHSISKHLLVCFAALFHIVWLTEQAFTELFLLYSLVFTNGQLLQHSVCDISKKKTQRTNWHVSLAS